MSRRSQKNSRAVTQQLAVPPASHPRSSFRCASCRPRRRRASCTRAYSAAQDGGDVGPHSARRSQARKAPIHKNAHDDWQRLAASAAAVDNLAMHQWRCSLPSKRFCIPARCSSA
eukprot:6198566-Pleurochrysis_carterae.AAC.3